MNIMAEIINPAADQTLDVLDLLPPPPLDYDKMHLSLVPPIGELPEADFEDESLADKTKDTIVEAGAFIGFRAASTTLWLGGIAASYYLRHKYGIGPEISMPTVGAAVTGVEYFGAGQATKVFDHGGKDVEVDTASVMEGSAKTRLERLGKELGSAAYVAWNGAMSAVKVNNGLGLETTPRRRLYMSSIYGFAVSIYSFPVLQEGAVAAAKFTVENPEQGVPTAVVGGGITYGVVRGIQSFREHRREKKQTKENTIEAITAVDNI